MVATHTKSHGPSHRLTEARTVPGGLADRGLCAKAVSLMAVSYVQHLLSLQ